MLGTPLSEWSHVNCSTTSKIRGIYLGENGTSQLQLCDKIYDDTVRSVFKRTEYETDIEDTEPNEKTET